VIEDVVVKKVPFAISFPDEFLVVGTGKAKLNSMLFVVIISK